MISAFKNIVFTLNPGFGMHKVCGVKRLVLVAGCWLLVTLSSFGQSLGDYRTAGNVTFSAPANWETYNGSIWVAAGAAPTNANGVITIQNGHTATVTAPVTIDQLIVNSTGILSVSSGQTLTIANGTGTDLDVFGTVNNSGIITPTGTIIFEAASAYNHAQDGVNIPNATWNVTSNCNITGVVANIGPATGLEGKTFGNFNWNCPTQNSNFYLASNFTVAGNFSVLRTGGVDHTINSLRMSTSGVGYTINVTGNFLVDNTSTFKMNNSGGSCVLNVGGNFTLTSGYFTIVTGTSGSIVNVNGNVIISGGNLIMKEDAVNTLGTLNVKGNFTQSGGIITLLDTPLGTGAVNFNGTSPQTFSKTAGTISNNVIFTVNSGAILDVGTSILDGTGAGFTLSAGGGIITANPQGFSSVAGTGSIQVTGTKTFDAGADYTYNGSVGQVTGNGISTVRNLTIDNPAGVTLSGSVNASGLLNLNQGKLTTGGFVLYLTNGTPGSLTYGVNSFVVGNFERAINSTGSNYYFPVGVTQMQLAKFNFANLTNGSLRVSFKAAAPAGSGLPIYDTDGQNIQYEFNNGYWTSLAQSGLASSNYELTLDAVGFNNPASINSSTRVIKRTGTGAWTINGTPGTVSGTVLERLACNGIDNASGTQFGAGTGNCFTFTGQPGSLTRCIGGNASFSVSISGGLGAPTYQWYKDGALLSNGGNISGATTNNLSVTNVTSLDEGAYTCQITDNCSIQKSQVALLSIPRPAAVLGYRFQKVISINHTKVSGGSDLYNFPLMVNIGSDPDLRDSIPHGGHVQNSNGYDIIFTDGNYNKLDHQVESYDPVTGKLIVWVRLPVLSASVNTTVLLLYDNPQIITDPSVKTVWNRAYQGVWHMSDNPAGTAPQLRDAAGSNNGTSNGAMIAGDLVPGNIGNGIFFDGSDDYFDLGTGIRPAKNFSEEFWIKLGSQSDNQYHGILGFHPAGGDIQRAPSIWIYNHNWIHAGFGDNSDWCSWQTPGPVLNNDNSTWNHIVVTFNGRDYKLFVNGTEVFDDISYAGKIPFNTPIQNIGKVANLFTGTLDEVRVLAEALSSAWISTEFNNEGTPGSFYSIGSQAPCSAYSFSNLCYGTPITYSVPLTAGHIYSWSYTGGTPSSPSGNSITMTWNPTGPYSIGLTESDGTCTLSSILYTVVPTAPPIAKTITKLPDLPDICVTGTVSATFSGGSGGVTPTDVYESSVDGGITWVAYIPGNPISSGVAGANRLQIRTHRTSTGTGCISSGYNIVTWNTVDQPVAQNITKLPNVTDVCVSGTVSATFSGGTGGVSPTDVYESSVDGGTTWVAYIPGNTISSGVAGAGRLQIRTHRTSAGTGCINSGYNIVTWNTVDQPVAQTITKLPNVTDVCVTGTVSATFSGGSGGVTPTDVYESSVDGGTTWVAYIPGNSISSGVAGTGRLQIRTHRTSAGTGCINSGYNVVTWNTVDQPVAQNITKLPNVTDVCVTGTVSATFSGGSGGVTPTDVYESSVDGGTTWVAYIPGNTISSGVAGAGRLQIRTHRTSAGTGCINSGYNIVTWNTVDQPVAQTITKLPNVTDVCVTGTVSATFSGGSGGVTPTDVYESSVDGGTTWVAYIPGNPISSGVGGAGRLQIRTHRTSAGPGCINSGYNVVTWNTVAQPVVSVQPAGATICYNTTHSMSVTVTGGTLLSYQWQISPNGTDTWTNVGTNSPNYTTAALTSNSYYKVIVTSTGAGCTTPVESNVAAVLIETTVPTITCPSDISKNVDAGACDASVVVPNPLIADNCSVTTLTWVMTGATTAVSAVTGINYIGTHSFSTGLTNITYVVKDGAGNQANCGFTVTVTDNIDPTITCPANIVTTTSADGSGNCTTTAILGAPVTADNCSVASVIAQVAGATINPVTYAFPIGITTVTWIVTDGSGRTATCNQTVTVTDDENPTITCPANIVTTTSADGSGNCTTTAVLGAPVTADNCSVASVIAQVAGATINPATYAFPIGITTVTWIVTDGSGRTATCNQTVTVTDDENPTITCPANIVTTTSADGSGNCTTTAALGSPVTADNCSVASVIAQVAGATINPATYAFPIGITTVTWIVTDGSGSTATCNQTVTVTDDENPVITCQANITHTADAGLCSYSVAIVAPVTTDNCAVSTVVGTRSDSKPLSDPYPVGLTTIHWVVTDAHGNTSSCDQTVTVSDDEKPAITCQTNITHTADVGLCSYSVAIVAPVTIDNCAVSTVIGTRSDLLLLTDPYPVGLTTIHWVVTDVHGNTNSCDQTVTVSDDEKPAITCQANITHTADAGLCSYSVLIVAPVTTDNCAVSTVVGTRSDLQLLTDTYPVGVTTIHWVVTDVHGNTNSCDQTVTVTDNENPAITCQANITHTADAGLCSYSVAIVPPVATDNCAVSTVVGTRSDSKPLSDPYPVGLTTIHWVVTDAHGNTNSCDQTVTVSDDEKPAITCQANITHTADAGLCSYSVAIVAPVTTDNCAVSTVVGTRSDLQLLTDPYPVGLTTIHWVVTDVHGNTNSCDQTVTVSDDEKPAITCQANITHTADAGLCSYSVLIVAPVTTDNCAVSTVVGTRSDLQLLTDTYPVGVTTIHWVVTDVHGNTNSCDQTVTVTDNENPAITCQANITHTADAGLCSYSVTIVAPVTTDNCAVSTVVGTRSDSKPLSDPYPVGLTSIHWVVTDVHGNSNSCDQTITVSDDEKPAITCQANITHTADAGLCSYSVAIVAPVTTDNCAVSTITGTRSDLLLLTDPYPVGVTTLHWVVTDVHGNTNSCDQTVTVNDDEKPAITCQANITHTADAGLCSYSVLIVAPVTTDNCAVSTVVGTRSDLQLLTDPYPVGLTTIHWVVTDVHGNTNSCDQTVTVTDNEIPAITCPADVTISCEDDNTPTGTGVATATDNCTPVVNITIGFSDLSTYSTDPSSLFHYNYVINRTWRATDVAGNYNECTQTITVHDITNPVITCPPDKTVNCDDDNTSTGTGTATATDNCTPSANITISSSDLSTYNPDPTAVLHYNYVITRTWRATDVAGNFSECNQFITVHDISNPVISCPADVTINCEDNNTPSATGTATASDNCTPNENIAIISSDVSTYDPLVTSILHYNYTIIRTWRATDIAGNYSECSQTITVHDITGPVISCPADIILNCEDDNTPAATGTATATDNCAPAIKVTITNSDISTYSIDPANILHYNYVISRTWRATDIAGNYSECIQTITVHDISKPVITCPVNVTLNCEEDNTPAATGTATATDICSPAGNIAITHTDASTYSPDPANVLHYNYVINRTWRATDVAGNFSECTQTIAVHDVTIPVISCPADITINCEADHSPAGTGIATATDICTPVGNIAITSSDASTYSSDPASILHYNYVITRTWRATDITGNYSECIQTITVHDITIPVITCPANVTISCEDDNTTAATGTATATDNCTPVSNIVITLSEVSTYDPDPANVLHYNYLITRTWRATDVTGNFSECIQTITVHDVTKPVIVCPANVTLNCQDDNTTAGTGTATATDNCSPVANIAITSSDLSTYSADPANVLHYNYVISRTWRATDIAGNYSECIQTITVHDVTSPVVTCPSNATINCDDDNSPTGTGTATATDNCAPVSNILITNIDVSTYNADPSSILHYNYVIIRTWHARDVAGNVSSCTQTIAVHDITKPQITCPGDITVNCNDDNTPSGTGTATATDNCTPVSNITITHIDVSTYSSDPANILHYNYVISRTWRATDVAGNYRECIQTITVHDVTSPVITCPADITISCEDDNTPTGTGTATATDNCSPLSGIIITSGDLSTYDPDPANILNYNYIITRTWRATDVAGNFSECVQTITVHDITRPNFTVPATITICRASDCTYDSSTSITGDVSDESDNCTPGTLLNATYTDDTSNLTDCNKFGFILRTWTLSDITGNTTVKVQTIWVEPTPAVVVINTLPIICNGSNVNLVFSSPTVSTIPGNLNFAVTVTSTDPAHLSGTASQSFTKLLSDLPFTLSGTLINSSDAPIIVTYTVTPKLSGCSDGPVQTTTVTVNPTPQVVPDKLLQEICNDASTSITLASPSTFTSGVITFSYTVSATGGVTGFVTPVNGLPKDHIISDILHNPTDDPQTVTYTIVPHSPTGCADGPSKTVIVTVNPTPQVIPSTFSQTLCNDGPTNIILNSPSTFATGLITFNYTVVATGGVTGFSTPVTGLPKDHIISDLLHNPTDDPQTVTYTIVPVSPTGCPAGPSKVVVITVNPTPQVIPSTLAQAICNDASTNITLGSPSIFSNGLITFNFSAVATGGITGFTASATGLSKDHIISDILHNPTDAPQTVTYTVVPLSPTGCSSGPVKVIVVTVDPTPQIVPSAFTQKVCNDGTTSIVLTSPSTFHSGAITFDYTVVATGGVTGFTSPTTGLPGNFVISDILHNPTNDPQTVTYTIVPISPNGCAAGPVKVVVITVEPTPQVNPSTLAQTICNDSVTNVLLTSPSIFANGVITFNYTVVATGGVTGFTTPVTGLPNNYIISDILHNPTDIPQTVTYTIVPISPECSATDPIKIVTVTVNPTPQVIPNTMVQTICNNGTTNIILGSQSTFTSGVIKFNYTVVATGGVTGFTTPVTGLDKDHVIADILNNPTDAPQTVTYTITPLSPTGCQDGPTKVVVVTVNPTPQVVPSILAQTICNDAALNITLGSPSTFNNGPITFNYTVVATGGVTGFTTPVTGLPKDHIISDILHNPTDSPQTVTYTIVPVSPSGCASGPVKVIVITVNPSPQVIPSTLTQTICNDGTTNVILSSPSTFTSGLITFNYTVLATGGVTGFTTPVNGLPKDHVISDLLHNPTDAPQTVTYTIIPLSPTGCPAGPSKTVVITVNPTPQVFPSTLTQTICNDGTTSVLLASPSTFSSGNITFNYTVVATGGVTGFSTPVTGLPKDFVIADILHNPTDAPQTVTYTIVPISPTGCASGPVKVVVITVNPTPQVVPGTLAQTICNDGTTAISLGSPTTFSSGVIKFNYTVVATGGVTGFTTPVSGLPKDFVISDVLHNPTDAPQTVTYTIVPVSPIGCPPGPSKVVVITVNPTPKVIPSTLAQTICNDGTTNVTLASPSTFTSGLITFNYTVVATGGVTGFVTPVNGLPANFVIADVLHNPTNDPQTVTYTIVPISPTGCAPGPSKVVVITINPTPQVVPSTLAQTLCNDGTTSVTLASPSTFSNGLIKFNYTVVATGGVTGFTTPVTGLPKDYIISDVLHNPTDSPQTVTYTVVPVSPSGCASGSVKIIVITINPTPRIFPVPANTIQCDSINTNIMLKSPSLFTSGLITFKYTVTTTGSAGSVTGYTTPAAGLANNQIIVDKLINTTDHYQVVTYRVVPVSPTGCSDGPGHDVTVTVNPTPKAILNNSFPEICYVNTPQAPVNTNIVLTSPTVMTSGTILFDYSVTATGGPGVIVGNTSPAANLPQNYTINYSYQNNSDTIQSVRYAIIPKIDNAICVPGRTVMGVVKVHARPLQSIVVTKPLTCAGGAGLAALTAVISKGADPYHTVWDGPVGYHKVDSLKIANLSSGKYVIKVTDNLGCNRKDSISIVPVTARAYISADVIPPGNYNITCIGSTDGQILVSVTGGITPPYKYWVIKEPGDTLYKGVFTNNLNLSDPSTYRYYNNLGAGTYTLLIRDVNKCENINRIVFRVPPPVVVNIQKSPYAGGFNISCKGYNDGSAWVQTITGGRGGFTYRWYTTNGNIPGPVNTNRIDNLIAGTYSLEIKDVLGCITIASVDILEPNGMQLAGSTVSKSADGNFNISCNGATDGSISLNVTGGSGNYLYTWTGPLGYTASTKDITGLKAGIYTCSVKDLNSCVLTPSPTFTLTEPTALVINTPVVSVSKDGAYNINCHGAATGTVGITVSGGSIGNYTYNWSTTDGSGIAAGQKDQSSLTAGTYHLLVTDMNNCTTSQDIILTQPADFVLQLSATNITCKSPGFNNGSVNLTPSGGIAPYSYLWSNGMTTEDISGLTAGDYQVTVTDFNGCIKTASARVDLPPALNYTKILSDYNGYNISCNGLANGFIKVNPTTGSAPFIYTWTGPDGYTASTKDITDIKAGQYQLLIVDHNECKASETFNITEPGKLGMTFSLPSSTSGGFNINCAGDSTGYITVEPVNQVNNVEYLWSDGIFGQTRTNLPAANYSIIISDENNCHASATIPLTAPDSLKLVFNITPPFCPDKPDGIIATSVTGGVRGTDYIYRWSDNSTNNALSNIPKGFYKVVVTDLNGCTVKDSVHVDPLNETCLVIPNAISPNGDGINDVWNIGLIELYPLMEVKIFNRWGESIWRSEKGYPKPWDGRSNGSELPIDSYHYIIDLHNGSKPIVGNITIVR